MESKKHSTDRESRNLQDAHQIERQTANLARSILHRQHLER